MKCIRFSLSVLFFICVIIFSNHDTILAQSPPKLDEAYLKKEYEEFKSFMNLPKPKPILYIEFRGGMNKINFQRAFDYSIQSDQVLHANNQIGNGYHAGINISYIVKKNLEIGVGSILTMIHSQYDFDYSSISQMNISEKINYLDVPVSFKYRLKSQHFGIYGIVGLNNSFLINSEIENTIQGTTTITTTSNSAAVMNHWIPSLLGGIGFDLLNENGGLFVEFRYAHGLRTITRPMGDRIDFTTSDSMVNQLYFVPSTKMDNLSISMGYKFLISKKIKS